MKKILLAFFFSIFFLNSQGQTSVYHPFPDSDASWCANSAYCGSPQCSWNKATYSLNGTLQINGKTYNRLILHEESVYSCDCYACQCTTSTTVYVDTSPCYIRQDTAKKQVWILNPATGIDTIFFDFNLHIGDTIDASKAYWYRNAGNSFTYIISSIDSILIDGQFRKQFNYSDGCSSYNHSTIEGIGSLHGLFYPPPCFEYGSSLNGFNQDGKILYGSQCANILNLQNVDNIISIKLSPNPASDKITISNYPFSSKEVRVEVYNMMGEKLQTSNFKPESAVDVSNLAAGVYLVEVRDGEKTYRSKIIKQ